MDQKLGGSEPCTQEKAEQVEKILRSRALQNSESLKALLSYVADKVIGGQDSQVKEYTIAVEVFGRGKDFNASIDSLVRVQAKRLRDKLREYYETDGKADKVVITIPKGHYNTVFAYRPPEPAAEAPLEEKNDASALPDLEAKESATSTGGLGLFGKLLLLAAALLLVAGACLAYWNRTLSKQLAGAKSPQTTDTNYGVIWEPFIKSTSPTLLILSNPPLFRFSNAADPQALIKNAIEMKPDQYAHAAEMLRDRFISKQPGQPKLVFAPREYTGIGEAIGLYRVAELLRSAGTNIRFKQSRTVSADDLKANNVVMLGSVWANVWSGKIPVKEDFEYTIGATIKNNNVLAGEQSEYRPKFNEETGDLVEDYALVTVRPGVTNDNTVMVLAGIESEGTQAAAEFVTSSDYLNIMDGRLRQIGSDGSTPKFYQALLKVDVDNGIPTTVSILAVHSLKAART